VRRASFVLVTTTTSIVSILGCGTIIGIQDTSPFPREAGADAIADGDGGASVVDAGARADAPDESDAAAGADAADAAFDAGALDAALDGAPIDPSAVSGLVLWLDGDHVSQNGNVLSKWSDRSGAGNDGTPPSGREPSVSAAALAGHGVVRFDGAQTVVTVSDAPSLQLGAGDYLVLTVAAYDNQASNNPTNGFGLLYGKNELPAPYVGAFLFANDPFFTLPTSGAFAGIAQDEGTHASGTGINDGNPHVIGMRRHGTTLDIIVDGTRDSSTVNARDVTAAGRPVLIGGGETTGTQQLHGYIAELVVVHGTVTDAALTGLIGGMRNRYALP
jgi:hypothetical protein